ncbi:MAG: glutamine synthetase [Kordiimonadaceae bacterium]|nr:glutamine synthetase [Kordiimonadaceae bacterium]MBO6568678.1 glutamine synthetase [Kordiimonadaceae bacterium]MBO6965346.1 glutamine synthetase [Kordiimonadaceae bacterium]
MMLEPVKKNIVDTLLEQAPDIEYLEVLAPNLAGDLFGKRYPLDQLNALLKDGMSMPRAMFVLSSTSESIAEYTGMGADDGDPDIAVSIVPETIGFADWGEKPIAQALITCSSQNEVFDPRSILARVLKEYEKAKLKPVVAFELEFTLFDAERDEEGRLATATNPKTGEADKPVMLGPDRLDGFEAFLNEVTENCKTQGIPTTVVCAEYGEGQFEINFPHYDNPLLAADHAQLFRRTVKTVARKHGFVGSFMAKPDYERAGNGQHIHASILDESGENIFDAGETHTNTLMHAIGGLQQGAFESMLFWAPNVNSYRRFEPENCVPTGATWAHEHRHIAFRIPLATGKAWRIENRVPGADANCYLTLATMLASMLHGIQNKIEPTEETVGVPEMDSSTLPLTLRTAIQATREGTILRDVLGTDTVELFANFREGEMRSFEKFISRRELDWYV